MEIANVLIARSASKELRDASPPFKGGRSRKINPSVDGLLFFVDPRKNTNRLICKNLMQGVADSVFSGGNSARCESK